MTEEKRLYCIRLFAAAVILAALSSGLSDAIFSNYFKDAFNVTALQRGFLETPRESGGVLCALVFLILGFLGDVFLGVIAQVLMAVGIGVMAFLNPSYAVMMIFLVIYSTGQHLFMPINDSIAMGLAEEDKGGRVLGRFKKYHDVAAMVSGALVFVGFKVGFFSFKTELRLPFAISFFICIIAALVLFKLKQEVSQKEVKSQRIALKKDYIPYYITTFAYGCQKRIRLVFAPWILIELLSQGADTIALSMIAVRLFGGIIAPYIGKFIDKNGIRISLNAEAAFIAAVFCYNGIVAGLIVAGGKSGMLWVLAAAVGYILAYTTEQFNMVHSVMLRKLAGDRKEDITANLSMGVTVDHIMAIAVSPILGLVWIEMGPAWVFYISALTALIQVYVAKYMVKEI